MPSIHLFSRDIDDPWDRSDWEDNWSGVQVAAIVVPIVFFFIVVGIIGLLCARSRRRRHRIANPKITPYHANTYRPVYYPHTGFSESTAALQPPPQVYASHLSERGVVPPPPSYQESQSTGTGASANGARVKASEAPR
jgi:hypothetical protein